MSNLFSRNSQLFKIWYMGTVRHLNSKIPSGTVVKKIDERKLPSRTIIDQKTVEHLERLSLVNFASDKGIKSLEEAIRFADQIRIIDTTGVEPMISVLENRSVYLRDDKVTEGNCRKDVMANAAVTEEEYFVAPPGNIPLLCERQCFVQPVLFTKDSVELVEYFKFGFAGELLKNNIQQEWKLSMVVNTDENVFPFHSCGPASGDIIKDLSEPFEYVKKLSNSQLPFGIAETREDVRDMLDLSLQEEMRYFYPKKHTTLWSCIFAQPRNAMQRFYQWQRQRKMWWRKFSASPGRFSLTDIQTAPDAQLVEIKAEFPWGSETVETIRYFGAKPFENSGSQHRELFEMKDGRRKVVPHVIESVVSLDTSVMIFICDAYDEPLFLGLPRQVMRFHRKLAPYKASFSASSSTASVGEELSELSLYLTKQLRSIGISTLLLPDVAKKSLESQFARNDEMGIPYTIVLNDATLKNGIVGMRSRDTTLKEQVHVSDLKTYMEKLLKNY